MQSYKITDVASVKFDSEGPVSEVREVREPARETAVFVTIPAGTRLSVRTIDAIDSTKNHVVDRFQASLEEPLTADGNVVIPSVSFMAGWKRRRHQEPLRANRVSG